MDVTLVEGDLLDQPTEAIVNAWNRNVIPWWLLLPQGVSGAIKQRAGLAPFRELGRMGPLPLGNAVHTSAGRLPFKRIIHVASIDLLWRASEFSVKASTRNAVVLAHELELSSLAMPLFGAGSGGLGEDHVEGLMRETLDTLAAELKIVLVRFRAG